MGKNISYRTACWPAHTVTRDTHTYIYTHIKIYLFFPQKDQSVKLPKLHNTRDVQNSVPLQATDASYAHVLQSCHIYSQPNSVT